MCAGIDGSAGDARSRRGHARTSELASVIWQAKRSSSEEIIAPDATVSGSSNVTLQ
jgi:hypothetical protein